MIAYTPRSPLSGEPRFREVTFERDGCRLRPSSKVCKSPRVALGCFSPVDSWRLRLPSEGKSLANDAGRSPGSLVQGRPQTRFFAECSMRRNARAICRNAAAQSRARDPASS